MSNPILFDTNIFVYALDSASPKHQKAKQLLKEASFGEFNLYLTPQNITETYRVITDTKAFEASFSPREAVAELNKLVTAFPSVYPGPETCGCLFRLLERYQIKKIHVFDVFLVATMLSNAMDTLFTDNEKDFKFFKEIEVVNPFR